MPVEASIMDPDLVRLARGRARIELEDRRDAFQREIEQIVGIAVGAGRLNTGFLIQDLEQKCIEEIRFRAMQIWSVIHRVISTAVALPLAPQLPSVLRDLVEEQLAPEVEGITNDLAKRSTAYVGSRIRPDRLETAHKRAIEAVGFEIELYLRSLTQSTQPASTVQHIYNAPVAVVQSGPASIATVMQHIEGPMQDQIVAALEEIRGAVAGSRSVDKTEILQLVAAAIAEVKAPEPRRLTLGGVLQAIATGIQTIPEVGPAYHALRFAAMHVGIHLP